MHSIMVLVQCWFYKIQLTRQIEVTEVRGFLMVKLQLYLYMRLKWPKIACSSCQLEHEIINLDPDSRDKNSILCSSALNKHMETVVVSLSDVIAFT